MRATLSVFKLNVAFADCCKKEETLILTFAPDTCTIKIHICDTQFPVRKRKFHRLTGTGTREQQEY